jgi:hypothetical protein
MKKFLKILSLSLILMMGLFLYACGAATVTPFISLENAYIELRIGEEGNETKSITITLSDYGSGSAQLNFSTDNEGLIEFSSEYIGGGKTKLTVTGKEPGTAIINVRSLQGGATKTVTVKVIQPIEGLSLKNDYIGKLYGIKGSTLDLKTIDFYNFTPSKTNEKDLIFEIKTLNSGCTLNNGVLTIGGTTNLDKIIISAKSKSKNDLVIDFEVKILKPVEAKLEVGYINDPLREVDNNPSNSYLKIYPSDIDRSTVRAVLTITAGTQSETLAIRQIFNSSTGQFLVSQTNYQFNNGKHIYTFEIQANSFDAGKIDSLIFEIFYENYTIGANNYNVKTNKLNINSYNSPSSIKVNNQTGEAEIEVFENSSNLTNGRLIEFTVLPGFLESGADKIRIWANGDLSQAPISLYTLNATRTAYNPVFGYNAANNKIECTNKDYQENNQVPYYETTSGAKLYAFVNPKYNSTTNKTATFYVQSSLYYNNGITTGSDKALTQMNFVVNPNAQNIYLADYENNKFDINYGTTINLRLGETITQYIAIDPATFILGSSSTVRLQNNNLAILGELRTDSRDNNFVYGKFTIQATKLGSTILTIALSDGKTKTITLNIVSVLEELDINIEDLTDNIESDIVAFANIEHTKIIVGGDNEVILNKISIANSGSSIQFLKNATPSNAQYYLTYSYYDEYVFANGVTIENAAIPKNVLETIQFKQSSSILNTTSMNNFSIIEPLSSKVEGNVLLRIEVYGMQENNSYGTAPVGVIYYLINFFVPVSSLNVTNGTLDLYPYESIGDLFVGENGQNLSIGTFNVSVNSNNGSVNPTYINTLELYVNGNIYSIPFTNNFCYLNKDGIITFSSENAAIKIVRTLTGNVYTFTVQAYKKVTTNLVFTLVVTEINNRKITGVARVFVKDVVEISDIELVNIDTQNGIYFENQNNSNTNMAFEIVTNLYSADGRDITDKLLVFDFEWEVALQNGVEITDKSNITGLIKIKDGTAVSNDLISIEINESGNYVITINKAFSGKGTFKIYPRSNYFVSKNGWNGENEKAYYEISIKIGEGLTEETAIEIEQASDLSKLNNSNKYYVLTANIDLTEADIYINDFAGSLSGYYLGKTYTIVTNKPLFVNILEGGIVKNLNIVALLTNPVAGKYLPYNLNNQNVYVSGFLACINEGQIIDVNIEADTNFDSAKLITAPGSVITGSQTFILGLLVGVNTGTIIYNNTTEKINVYGVNDGINGAGSTYAGGIVGFNIGTIDGACVAVTVVGTNIGNYAGNELEESHGTIINCTFGAVDIEEFKLILNPNNKKPSELITNDNDNNDNDNTAILYYYEVLSGVLNKDETRDLKDKNTFTLANLLKLQKLDYIDDNDEFDFSLFNIISSNRNILSVVGDTLEIKDVGKVQLTITPRYSTAEDIPTVTITIYIIYPINSYEIYEGISVENSKNKIDEEETETINIKKSGTHYFTTYLKNTISLGNDSLYTIVQNKIATELFVKDDENTSSDFTISGNTTNYTNTSSDPNIVYRGLGTISITTSTDSGEYLLYSNLVLQNSNQVIGNLETTEINHINTLIKEAFSKEIKLKVYVGAEKIQSSIIGAEIDPSNVLTIDVSLTTDNPNSSENNIKIEIRDERGDLVWKEENKGNIFEIRKVTKNSFLNGKITYSVHVYIQDSARSKIVSTKNYVAYIYAVSDEGIDEGVFITVNVTVKPQEIISVTYSHHNRDDLSDPDNFKVKDEPSSALNPGDSGLLAINLYPTYSTYKKIVIESELVNSNYVLLEQMYKSGDIYLTANGTNGYSNLRENNRLIINYTDAVADDNGMVYIRTKILSTVVEGLYFPIIVKIYAEENGVEKLVKSEQIVLVSQIVDGSTITINGEKEAVVPRGHDSEIKISVPIYQELSELSIIDKNQSNDPNDVIRIYFNKAEYEIVGSRKIYTGILGVGLNAELKGDGVFGVQTVVSRIINGRLETAINSITVTVVDFLVEGIYVKGNNEEDNVFDTPLGIEKELEFEFKLTPTPSAYDAYQQDAVERIENAKKYFKENMAYKYANDTNYSYIINTSRIFIKESITDPVDKDYLSHVVSTQAPNSIAYNLYYTNNLTPYINQQGNVQENQYASIAYNSDGDISDFASNLLKVTGKKVGAVSFTIRIGYQIPGSTEISYINYIFFINVQVYSDEDKPIPIDDAEEFIEYLSNDREENREKNYILMDDITLINFVPFTNTNFKSLDGNNKVITIKNFDISSLRNSSTLNLSVFRTIASNSTVKNLTISLYELEDIIVDENQFQNINVAGLAIENNGIVYNCEVIALDKNNVGGHDSDAGIRVYFSSTNKDKSKKDTTTVNIAGLVIDNYLNGCVTNSRVGGYVFEEVSLNGSTPIVNEISHKNINIIGQGNIVGFVLNNRGVISSSYFANGTINNKSVSGTEAVTSGFVFKNSMSGSINGSYSKGIKLSSDLIIYVTGGGIVAQGIAAGFVYENEGHITDCYSNIKLAGTNSGRIVSGFVYNNKNTGLIERCYSASTIVGELTTQMPFTGNNARGENLQEVVNGLVNCYYIVRSYGSDSILEEKYSTGAVGLGYTSLSEEKLYGLSFVSNAANQDGTWEWKGNYAELVESNNIAISARYVIKNYSETGGSIESINVFPYIKGYEYGSARNPIIIRTADEFNRVFGQETSLRQGTYYAISQMYDKARGIVFGNYRLVSHIDFNELNTIENIKVSSSIMTLTKKGEYRGILDGNGLTISNIEITLNSQAIVGLISKLSNSAVLKNVNLTVIKVVSGNGVYVGGAVGQVENSFVSNVTVSPVNIIAGDDKSQISGYNIVGGVVGYVVGQSRLSNLTSNISVTSLLKTSNHEYNRNTKSIENHRQLSYVGGVAGVIDIYNNILDTSVYSSKINVNKLKYYGKNVIVQGKYVGGVVGYVGLSTYFVDALFEITGNPDDEFNQKLISYGNGDDSSIGGVVGVNYGKLFEIRVEHELETQELIEYNLDNYYKSTTNLFRGITNLFNTLGSELKYIGGLVGSMMAGEISTSYAKVDVVNLTADYAGGLIGYNKAETTFYELFAFGDVDAKIVGGLVGINSGKINLSLCVAMNYYNKNNSHIKTKEDFIQWVNSLSNASLKEINDKPSSNPEEIELKFKDSTDKIISKKYTINNSYNNQRYISVIHETLGDELYRFSYNDGIDRKIISDGLNYWLWNQATSKWDILERQNYGKFGFDYRYYLENNVIFYCLEDEVYIYVDPVITQSGYTFTLPTTLDSEERISFSTSSSYPEKTAIINITEYYRNATNGTIYAQVYKGQDPLNNNSEIYVYIDKSDYKLVKITGSWELGDPSDSPITSMFYSYLESRSQGRTIPQWLDWFDLTTYDYTYHYYRIIIENSNQSYSTYYKKLETNHKNNDSTTITTELKNEQFNWNLENLGRKYRPSIYSFSNYFLEKYANGTAISITNDGDGNLSSEFNNELSPPKENTVILEKIGSIIGENSNNSSYNFANVYATTHLILNGLRFNLSSVSNGTATYSAKSLTVNNNIASFNRNIDTITTNEMFINAGWDNSLWVKEDNRIFPRLTFGITTQILYIEKPSDLVKLYKYNSQSNTVIFGDDPGTLFNPYKYDKTDISTWHNLSEKELRGLDVRPIEGGSLLIYDITYLADLLQEIGLEYNDFYFEKFLGEMYGEIENNEYMISGIKKTLFNEIIGGSVKNLIFTTIPYTNGEIEGLDVEEEISDVEEEISDVGVIEGPVLTNNILSETSLKDLTFKDINITSSKPNIGIIAQQITNVSLISDITFKNCFINSEFNNTEVPDFANVGGIAGIMESTNDTNYSIKLENIDTKGLQINIKGKDSSYATNANVGLIFGSINCNATYIDCILRPLTIIEGTSSKTIPNLIQVDVDANNGEIYAGGYVGYASDLTQSIINSLNSLGNRVFVQDLYILIGNGNSVKAGLLFGEAKVYSKGKGITGKTDEDLNISISGFITNKYFAQENNTLSQKSEAIIPIIAEVGGVVGRGSGNICGINVEGVLVGNNYVLIDFETKGANISSPTDLNAGESQTVKIGGVSGNSTMDNLLLSNVNISGDIIVVNNSTDNQILSVGGLVGFTGNTFTILDSNYKNKKVGRTSYTSEITVSEKAGTLTTVYAGGIVGYSDTNGGSVFNLGKYENSVSSNGNIFDGNIIISGKVSKLYAGGIIGTTSDAVGTNGDKVNIYDSKISGNIEVQSIGDNSELYIGGVAGYIVGDIIGNYAWGNIKLNDGLNVKTLQLGGIISQLNGIDANNKASFNSNYSLTSMYNENRATTTHLVRALIGKRNTTTTTVGTSNYYCHQINLCIDTIGTNLPYNDTTNYGATAKETILQKFEATGLTSSATIGEKLRPNSISTIDTNTSFAANNYYVLTANITSTATKDVAGHLVGDGFKITTTNITPFGTISGYVSGLNVTNNHTESDTNAIGVASKNTGIVFAVTALVKAYNSDVNPSDLTSSITRRTIHCGFITENTGLISDCGTVLYGSSAGTGFCTLNSGIIINSYATGSLSNGVINDNDSTYQRALFAGSYGTAAEVTSYSGKGTIINCYVALKASSSTAAFYGETITNCYYDRNAAEKNMTTGSGSSKTTNEMALITGNSGNSGFIANDTTQSWRRDYDYNFGYPTLSAGAYANFSGYMRNFFYTGDGSTNPIQIISAGKITQINKDNTTLGRSYVLLQNFDLSLSGYTTSWAPIGDINNHFKGTFDGNGYTISNIPSISVQNNAGFFSVNNGTIKNCNFNYALNATVNATLEENFDDSIWIRAGGVVAMNYGTIQTVSSSNATIDAASDIGGICAYNNGDIISARNSNSIKIDNSASHIGGIVGYMESGTIKTSTNNEGLLGYKYVGGIVGTLHSGEINSCTNLGVVIAGERAGGIVGNMENGIIKNCLNNEDIYANEYAGGIVGYAQRINTESFFKSENNKGGVYGAIYAAGIFGAVLEVESDGVGYNLNNTDDTTQGILLLIIGGMLFNFKNTGEISGGTTNSIFNIRAS